MKIVADNKIPFLKGALEPFAEVNYIPGKEIKNSDIVDADALIVRTRTMCNRDLLEGSKVRFIATATIGFDHIDTSYCENNGITWQNAPGCNSGSVMQYVASVLVRLAQKFDFNFEEKTIGVIGVGNVGSKVARLAESLGMNVLLNDPPRERKEGSKQFVDLSEIQEKADIISFHVPLNNEGDDKTYHLFNAEFLQQLKKTPILINSSRGEVIDESVLKSALKASKIKAAVLDVWEKEPQIDLELLELVDIATPHIAGYSLDGKANGTKIVIQSLSKFFNQRLNNWNPEIVHIPKEIIIDCQKLKVQEIIHEAILRTYDILEDDKRFRESPKAFEQLRGDYPIRREFMNHTLTLKNTAEETINILRIIGFNIKEI